MNLDKYISAEVLVKSDRQTIFSLSSENKWVSINYALLEILKKIIFYLVKSGACFYEGDSDNLEEQLITLALLEPRKNDN